MIGQCAECGAEAEIQDDRRELCPLCSDFRDVRSAAENSGLLGLVANVENAQHECRRMRESLKASHALLEEDVENRGSLQSLLEAIYEFNQARDTYQQLTATLKKRTRDLT
jgi:hypothetical protein